MTRKPPLPSDLLPKDDLRHDFARYADSMVRLTRWRVRLAIPIALILGAGTFFLLQRFSVKIGFGVALPLGFVVYAILQKRLCRVPWVYDYRAPVLVLRSFSDDRAKLGDELPPGDYGGGGGRNPFIWQLTQALWDWCRVILLQEEANERGLQLSGIVMKPADDWKDVVLSVAQRAWVVLVFPASTTSCIEELELLVSNSLLAKTVIYMPPSAGRVTRIVTTVLGQPPSDTEENAERWERLRDDLRRAGWQLPSYEPRGLLYTPNPDFSIAASIDLRHNDYPWSRLPELAPGPGVLPEPLWNVVRCGQAFEADDPDQDLGGVAATSGFKPGWRVVPGPNGTLSLPPTPPSANTASIVRIEHLREGRRRG